MARLEDGFHHNAFHYLLFLRLVPIFPFWMVNIAAALLNVSFRVYVAATFLGIIPGTFIYVWVGQSLASLFAKGQMPNLGIIFSPTVLVPLLLLSFSSLVPILYKKFKQGGLRETM